MADRKSVLVVEDDREIIELTTENLERRGYSVTPINYLKTQEIPTERFDIAIVDGLNGEGIRVLQDIDAERKFLYSGDYALIEEAEEGGLEAHSKLISLKKILGDEK